MSLHIYTSNHMENLVSALAGVVARPLSSPLTPEVIVVQSKGMQRWLAMELAGRFGVWANCDYPFPNDMVWRLFQATLPHTPDASAFDPEVMAWNIMGLLPRFLDDPEFIPLRRYLEGDPDGLKLYQLAHRIADSLDQYTLFRPDLMLSWETGALTGEGGDEAWQARLWRELVRTGDGRHRARLRRDFLTAMAGTEPAPGALPERVALFGISYLPTFHMEALAAVSRHTQVNLFLLSPTSHYWSDIVSRREMARLAPERRESRVEGNSLLASLGRLGRDFSDMIIEAGELASLQEERYREPGEETLLRAIQSRILNLEEGGEGCERHPVADEDISVQIHSCHSPLREMEALHDNLLNLLERVDGLEPRHIVVMTPDIETYAPYIATVFEGSQDLSRRIPYSIADRSMTSEGRVASVVLKLFSLPGSRLGVVQLLDILESEVVARRFECDERDLELIRRWLAETRVNWGLDERDRSDRGLPSYRDNSWAAGLDRLLLGYAMPDKGQLFHGILPCDGAEGSEAPTLGKLLDFVQSIAGLVERLKTPATLKWWGERLRRLLEEFIRVDDHTARELDAVAGVVADLAELGQRTGYDTEVSPAVMRSWLTARLSRQQKGLGFMTGGVTFCAMLPMRSIPFRVVALVGMCDGAFPRQSRSPGFDLIARSPRRGDRSLRDEDRYLFLEAILSARDCLYLSYVGQSIKDNSEIPPSVLVAEFQDAIERGFVPASGGSVAGRPVTRHRLQAFSTAYFLPDGGLFSYSAENCEALRERLHGAPLPEPFLSQALPEPEPEWRTVTLEQLIRFFRNPAKFFLEQRLGIRLEEAEETLEEREAFDLRGLESYGLKRDLLECALQDNDPLERLAVIRAQGILPPALHGEHLFRKAALEVTAFAEDVRSRMSGEQKLPPTDFELVLGNFRFSGRLDGVWTGRMLRYRCARLKGKDQMQTWLEHLVLNAVSREDYPQETLLLMTDGERRFLPVNDAAASLESLMKLYWSGLSRPLPFFPVSSMAYANKLEWKLERAIKAWEDGYAGKGEGRDPHFRLCFGVEPPFGEEFQRVARLALAPMLDHLE